MSPKHKKASACRSAWSDLHEKEDALPDDKLEVEECQHYF